MQYELPPIKEVFIKLEFIEGFEWDIDIPGRYLEAIRPLGFDKISSLDDGSDKGFLIKSDKIPISVHVCEQDIVVDHTLPYTNWETFSPKAFQLIDTFIQISEMKKFQNIGLHYHNVVGIPDEDTAAGEIVMTNMFNVGITVNPETNIKARSFMLGLAFPANTGDGDYIKVEFSVLPGKENNVNEKYAFQFDVCCFNSKKQASAVRSYKSWLRKAHENINGAFESLITNELRTRFKEVTP